jgi:hypothetical protein
MQGWVFKDDSPSLHRANETKEAPNGVCVAISGANLHESLNSPDLNRIKQMGDRQGFDQLRMMQ